MQQDWLGAVELTQCGTTCSAITSGQTVTITASGGSPTWSGSTYDAWNSYAWGVWGPTGIVYEDVDTWFHITEEVVDNGGNLITYSPHTVSTNGTYMGSSTFSYDGNSTTHPVSPDIGLPYSNDTNSSTTGRYQLAQIHFGNPTAVRLTSFSATVQASPLPVGVILLLGLAGIGVLLGYQRWVRRL